MVALLNHLLTYLLTYTILSTWVLIYKIFQDLSWDYLS